MLYTAVVKSGTKVDFPTTQGQTLHLSQACLHKPKGNATTYLQILDGENVISLCALAKDKCEHASLDLFVQPESGVQLAVEGQGEIHVAGYFEPEPDAAGFEYPDMSDEEEEEEEGAEGEEGEGEELIETAKALPGKRLAALMPDKAQKKGVNLHSALAAGKGKGAEEEEAEDSDEDEESDGDSEVDTEAVAEAIAAAKAKQGGKRSAPDTAVATPAAKKQAKKDAEKPAAAKTPAAKGKESSPDEAKYVQALTEYLKAHGRSPISQLGAKVKKPQGVAKLSQFVKQRGDLFKVENGFVALK